MAVKTVKRRLHKEMLHHRNLTNKIAIRNIIPTPKLFIDLVLNQVLHRLDSHHKRVVLIVVNFSSISCSQTADKSNDEFPSIEGFKKPS